ncbi:MAG: hypothetical protein J4F39_00025 [Candidatus Latescibacteria bacterium]|nr:hypothetical protein [Candidatus Latescibacterota bacterium]
MTEKETDRQHFFPSLKNPQWIRPLAERKCFDNPPNMVQLPDGYLQCPFWPELEYLRNVCIDASNEILDEIIQIVLKLPSVDNPRVYANILDIALQLDGKRSAQLLPKMLEYARLEHQFFAFKFPDLLANWLSEDQTDAALKLANVLVQFVPDPKAEEKQKQKRQMNGDEISSVEDEFASVMTILRPLPRFNENYREILNKGVRPLAKKEPYKVARMLINTTATMICLGKHEDDLESDRDSDYSEIWCPRLDKPKDDYPDLNESLVQTLTFACEKSFERESESIEALDSALRDHGWDVFKRIRQHLFALYPNPQTLPWIRKVILKHPDYGRWEHHYEFQRMIRSACEHFGAQLLTEDERSLIFDAILSGPPEEDFREWLGDKFTEIEFKKRRKYFHHQQLRPFASVLFGKYADNFRQLEADETTNEITDESYQPYGESKGGRVKARSPVSTQDLASLSDEKLLEYINQWEDEYRDRDDLLTEINIEALAGAFQKVFEDSIIPDAERLDFWIDNRANIRRPIYIRMMINAMQDVVKDKDFENLEKWFAFCECVLTHPDSANEKAVRIGRLGDGSREHPNWHTSRRAVCDFIETCIKADVNVPYSVCRQLGALLNMLCSQFDSNLDKRTKSDQTDPLTAAINSTRGRALENLVNFEFWVRRYDEKAEVNEMKEIIEKRTGSKPELPLTIPEYAILGRLYTSVLGLDEKWAADRKSAFFPRNNMNAWSEAIGNYLRWGRRNLQIFEKLRDEFEFAVDHMDWCGKKQFGQQSAHDLLGQHLFCCFLWGTFPLKGDDSLLERFYNKSGRDRTLWASLFAYVGRTLENSGKELDNDSRDRIIAFFEWRLDVGEPTELHQFVTWLEAECLEVEWRLNAYSRILDLFKKVNWSQWKDQAARLPSFAIHSISKLIPAHTAGAVDCLARLIESMPTDGVYYIPTEDAKTILQAGRDHDEEAVREKSDEIRENMLKRGFLSVKN